MSKIDDLIERLCPDGVEYKKIGDVCSITRGKVISKKYIEQNHGIYPVFSSQTLNDGVLGHIDSFDYDGEYITWTTDGANAGTVFRRFGKFNITNVCGLLKPNISIISLDYLYFVLSKDMKQYVSTGMGNPKLMSNVVQAIKIPVPPLEIQKEIVRVLDSFAELEAELERRKAQYVYYRDELFLSKVFSTAFLKDLLQDRGYIRGPFGSALRKSEMTNEGIPVYEQQHAIYNHRDFRYYISYEKAKSLSRFKVKQGDLIVSCSGTVGSISIISENDKEGIINQALLILRCDSTIITPQFLKCYLCTTMGRNKLLKQTNKSAQINIAGRDQIEAISIPVPPLEEQQRIVDILDKFDALVNDISQGLPAEIEARRKQYEYYRDKLLTFKEKVN